MMHLNGREPRVSSVVSSLHTLSKEINTTLAGLMLLLTMGTYWFLMSYTTTLSNETILPSKFLQDNLAAVLSPAWLKHYIGSPKEIFDPNQIPWVLFYMRETEFRESAQGRIVSAPPIYEAKGYNDVRRGDFHL